MFIGRAASFIYPDEGSEFAKSILESLNCLDAFDLQCDYCIGEPLLGGCRLCIALWDEWTKMRKALINKLIIIIYLDYLKGMEMHGNVL